MINMTLLEKNQILGEKQLEIFKRYGTGCSITDFAVLLGGHRVSRGHYTSEGRGISNLCCSWWTKTDYSNKEGYSISADGQQVLSRYNFSFIGGRPVLPYSAINNLFLEEEKIVNNIKEIVYGEYPQSVVKGHLAMELEEIYKFLDQTGKVYTTDSEYSNNNTYSDWDEREFKPKKHIEYEYENQRYVRVVYTGGCISKLTNEEKVELSKAYWIKVEPLVWLVDEKADIAITKKAVFAGIQFNKNYYDGDFKSSNIYKFMNKYFAKEIITNKTYSKEDGEVDKFVRKQNPYNFTFKDIYEEDIIRGAVESDIAVFLHGKSSDGKSARVKQIDPDCEIIYLGSATPDSLNGKSVYNASTGEMIDVPPSWFKKVSKKCEEEPDKIHIVFLDELTNAMPSIQKYAFNIVLDKEVNGIWKLPKNCRIVAAGNEVNDSLAANQMAEPLFNRFAHVYINTTVTSWLRWAMTPNNEYKRIYYKDIEVKAKIHPSIYSYIAYKSYTKNNVLRTLYDGEKPNADPRKWEMASKMLYVTNNPNMLRALIGQDLTKDFVNFCKKQVITVEDVVNGNYSKKDLEMNVGEKFATAVGLSQVSEKDFMVVRNFVRALGAEVCATFDSLWSQGDEKRLEKISELQVEDIMEGNFTYGY